MHFKTIFQDDIYVSLRLQMQMHQPMLSLSWAEPNAAQSGLQFKWPHCFHSSNTNMLFEFCDRNCWFFLMPVWHSDRSRHCFLPIDFDTVQKISGQTETLKPSCFSSFSFLLFFFLLLGPIHEVSLFWLTELLPLKHWSHLVFLLFLLFIFFLLCPIHEVSLFWLTELLPLSQSYPSQSLAQKGDWQWHIQLLQTTEGVFLFLLNPSTTVLV